MPNVKFIKAVRAAARTVLLPALLYAALPGSTAIAAELLMLERAGCAWCARWNAEIGPAYHLTEEGRRAPLRRIDVTAAWPGDLENIEPDRYTPTFILVENGVEIARLRGYPGDNFFWPLLGEMLASLPRPMEDSADAPKVSAAGRIQ